MPSSQIGNLTRAKVDYRHRAHVGKDRNESRNSLAMIQAIPQMVHDSTGSFTEA